MARQWKVERDVGFKDYYLILQVHPAADAAMIDAAYWHLARRYGEARLTDSSAKAMMDDLNEAYSVLRSSERRVEYGKLRDLVLGAEALPLPPRPAHEPAPLQVMERQRPRAREGGQTEVTQGARQHAWRLVATVGALLAAAVFLALTIAALAWGQAVSVVGALAAGVGLSVLALLLTQVKLPRLHVPRPRLPSLSRHRGQQPPAAAHPAFPASPRSEAPEASRGGSQPARSRSQVTALEKSTKATISRWREGAAAEAEANAPRPSSDVPDLPDDSIATHRSVS
jgi:curved DNA-binding protein CbpA